MTALSIQEDYRIITNRIHSQTSEISIGTKLLFVIQGAITVHVNMREYQLAAGDILVINRQMQYTIQGEKNNIVVTLTITDAFFAYYYPEYFHYAFECFSKELDPGRERIVAALRRHLSEMVLLTSENEKTNRLEVESALLQLLLLLTRFFKKELAITTEKRDDDNRISRIVKQLQEHYDESITLNDLAKQEFLSSTYLSRYFKKVTGYGFLQYLTEIRLKHALQDLLYTSLSITEIALKNGFSSQKNFSEIFKQQFKLTPTAYRLDPAKQKMASNSLKPLAGDMEELLLTPEILVKLASYYRENKPEQEINNALFEQKTIQLKEESVSSFKHVLTILTIGELTEVLKENVREEIIAAQDEVNIEYIGVRHLLRGKTILPDIETDEVVPTSSPHANSDLALTFLKQRQLSLFIRIEYHAISADEKQAFEKLDQFLRHSIQAFGRSYVSKWRIMFFEPANTFADKEELQRVYLELRRHIKAILPNIQVGNFVHFSASKNKIPQRHDWILKLSDQLDFITYNANQNEAVDFSKNDANAIAATENYCLSKTRQLKQFLQKNKMNKPLILINWNTLTGNTRRTNGFFFRGALILKNLLDLTPEVDGIGYWINTELHEEDTNIRNISLDGMELFHFFKGKRPAFYAAMFMNKLSGKIVAAGSDFIMTKNEEGYQLVLLNCATINPYYSLEEKFLKEERKELHVHIFGIEKGEYQVRKWQFDRDNGALYSKYWQLNSKHGFDEEAIDYIVRASQPTLTMTDEQISSDWSFYTNLDMNAIHFYDIRRVI